MNMNRRITLATGAFLLVVAMLAIALPGANAQASQAQQAHTQDGDGTIIVTPFGPPSATTVTAQMTWNPGTVQPTQAVPVTIDVAQKPSWLTIAISPTTVLCQPPAESQGGGGQNIECAPSQVKIQFSAKGGTPPARQPASVNIDFSGSAPTGSDVEVAPKTLTLKYTVTAEYYSILGFKLSNQFSQVGPQDTANYPLTIQNLGNGNTYISFKVSQVGNKLWQVPTPNPFVVQATQTGAESNEGTVNLQVTTARNTRYYDDLGVVTYDISTWFASDSSIKGQSSSISVMAYFNGVYVPGFEMVGAVGVLAAVAILLKRRQWSD